ncbi:hypothetical protein [Lentzea guizhouensis]|uniref:hypothetical protein n=1 Tax=Lentzea guizhouensis TaxID=1586287 RepID=UPI001C54DD0E|nr:hypothetical protein [Lentzea guizhouensis]
MGQVPWLGEVSAVVLQQALADLNTAYRNFFASVMGKRKGNRQAIRFTRNARFAVLGNGRLRLPKIGDLACAGRVSCPRNRPR